MQKTIFLALAIICGNATAQMTVGGTLHRATLREWHQASIGNQIATAADLVESVLNLRDPVAIAPKARDVQACINRVADNFKEGSQLVADTALACMAQLGYLPRRY